MRKPNTSIGDDDDNEDDDDDDDDDDDRPHAPAPPPPPLPHRLWARAHDCPFALNLARFTARTSHWNDGHFGGKFVWSHRHQNMIILLGFILFFRFATFYALERINYSTR